MKQMIAAIVLCIVCAGASAQALDAQGAGGARMQHAMQQLDARFSAANVTHDGKLTREQAQQGMPRVAQHFDEIDTLKAGYVTLPQIQQFMMQQAAAR
ncbi:EF-hand domain-containing protein [Paraburkholderia phosphatilytica]|uniref:EF-hand domain-containing protein n=1 Tax=Paraburkholderia phosphatilytica TaxID=2282883 RepID=UPI000E500AC7|nr:EF-hand domain-containing protein [Paraburkholderia phosphatilytica]